MSKFKVGDRVRIKRDISTDDKGVVESMCQYGGDEVTIIDVYESPALMSHYNVAENVFFWDESTLEPIVPSLIDIKEKKLSCIIHTSTEEQFNNLINYIEFDKKDNRYAVQPNEWWNHFHEETCVRIKNGMITGCANKKAYDAVEETIYEFGDTMQDGGVIKDWTSIKSFSDGFITNSDDFTTKLQEYYKEYYTKPFNPKTPIKAKKINNKKENDNNMKLTFFTEQGERIDKTCNEKIPTVTTYAISNLVTGDSATATCDKCDYDRRTGALVAAAKVISKKSEETHLMYDIAMKMWGSDFCNAILETFANRAYAGNFEKYYDKWIREEKKLNDDKCKCNTCGKKFDTPDDAREHEEWHAERKRVKRENYLIRKEAKRRLAEKEKENKIEKAIIEIKEEEKEKNKNK